MSHHYGRAQQFLSIDPRLESRNNDVMRAQFGRRKVRRLGWMYGERVKRERSFLRLRRRLDFGQHAYSARKGCSECSRIDLCHLFIELSEEAGSLIFH